jgi:hypothetical protein
MMGDNASRVLQRAVNDIMNNAGQEDHMTRHRADPLPREPRDLQPQRATGTFTPCARPGPPDFRQEEEELPGFSWETDAQVCAEWFSTWGPRRPTPQSPVPQNIAARTSDSSERIADRNRTASRVYDSYRE